MNSRAPVLVTTPLASRAPLAAALTIGFGTSVALWGVAYVARLPALLLPSPVVLVALLLGTFCGGWVYGRHSGGTRTGGALAGAVSGAINLLVLGSFLGGESPERLVPSALWWIPGSVALSALLAGAGAAVGSRAAPPVRAAEDWTHAFAWVAAASTALLLAVGGVVTSAEAGLAVDDWPTSFGYNMFLYPFSRMTGGIYYEHAHRLIGALVGLTTVVLAALVQRTDQRRGVRALAWLAVAMVVIQGVLGGLRVTQRDLALAMIHGILAQLFFATVVGLAAATSPGWRDPRAATPRDGARTDRLLTAALVGVTIVQLALGAAQRHFQQLLLVHVVTGIAIVAPLALHIGVRAWALNPRSRRLRRYGVALIGAVCVQVLLGFGAWVATDGAESGSLSAAWDLSVATAHQWFGAILLATAVTLAAWSARILREAEAVDRVEGA